MEFFVRSLGWRHRYQQSPDTKSIIRQSKAVPAPLDAPDVSNELVFCFNNLDASANIIYIYIQYIQNLDK
jgi:hypothetical protein